MKRLLASSAMVWTPRALLSASALAGLMPLSAVSGAAVSSVAVLPVHALSSSARRSGAGVGVGAGTGCGCGTGATGGLGGVLRTVASDGAGRVLPSRVRSAGIGCPTGSGHGAGWIGAGAGLGGIGWVIVVP